MKVTNHVKLSLVLSLPVAYLTGSLTGIAWCIAGGVLIDVNHIMDYYLNYRKLPDPIQQGGFFSGRMLMSFFMDSPQVVGRRMCSKKNRQN